MNIKRVTESDHLIIGEIAKNHQASYIEKFDEYATRDMSLYINKVVNNIRHPFRSVWYDIDTGSHLVVEDVSDECVVGAPKTFTMEKVYVKPENRGNRIGDLMMQAVCNIMNCVIVVPTTYKIVSGDGVMKLREPANVKLVEEAEWKSIAQ